MRGKRSNKYHENTTLSQQYYFYLMTPQQVHDKLIELGALESDIPQIVDGVSKVIFQRVAVAYDKHLTDAQKQSIAGVPAAELMEYMATHAADFPNLDPKITETIISETWQDYFIAMKK